MARSAAGGKLSDEEFAHVMQDGMEARQRLVVCNLALVVSLSNKYKRSHFNCNCLQACVCVCARACYAEHPGGTDVSLLDFCCSLPVSPLRRNRRELGSSLRSRCSLRVHIFVRSALLRSGRSKHQKLSFFYCVCPARLAFSRAQAVLPKVLIFFRSALRLYFFR